MGALDKYAPVTGNALSRYESKTDYKSLLLTTPEEQQTKKETYIQSRLAHVEGPPEFQDKMRKQFAYEWDIGQKPVSGAISGMFQAALPLYGAGAAAGSLGLLARGAPLAKAVIPAAKLAAPLLGYAGLNKLYDIPKYLEKNYPNLKPWVKDVAVVPDILSKGAILGAVGAGAMAWKRGKGRPGVIDIKGTVGEKVTPESKIQAVLPKQTQEVPFSKLVESSIVTSTPQGTQVTPTLFGEFTADQNLRVKISLSNIISSMGIQNTLTNKPVTFGDFPATFRNVLTNKALELQHTETDPGKIQEAIQALINEERSNIQSPLVVVSGVGKASALERGAIDASLEVFVVPMMSSMNLRELANYLAAKGISPANARFVYTALNKRNQGVPDLVRQTAVSLYNTALKREGNILPQVLPEQPQQPTIPQAVEQVIQEMPEELTPGEILLRSKAAAEMRAGLPPEAPAIEAISEAPTEVEEIIKEENQKAKLDQAKELIYGPEDYSPAASLTDPDVMAVKQYYDTLKELQRHLFLAKKDKAAQKWVKDFYDKELDKIYDSMTPVQQAFIDNGDLEKALQGMYKEMAANLKEGAPALYSGFTAKQRVEMLDLEGKSHSLLGSYVVWSKVGEDWKFGLWQDATAYKIQDGDKFEISREAFEDTVRENLKDKLLSFDDYNIAMGGLSEEARAIYDSLKATDTSLIKKAQKAVQMGDEVNVPLLTALQKSMPGRAFLRFTEKILGKQKTKQVFTKKSTVDFTDEMFDVFKNERIWRDVFALWAHDTMYPIQQKVTEIFQRDFPGLKRDVLQEGTAIVNQLMQSANGEIYCSEGDAKNYAVTDIGIGGPHMPGQFTSTSEADGFLKRAAYFIKHFKIDEPWLRQTYNIPPNIPVDEYLQQTRPKLFFYTMLTHPNVSSDDSFQALLRLGKATRETPYLNELIKEGVLDKADMANNVQRGFANRVWTYADTQQRGSVASSARASGPFASANIEAAKYRTYEEYLEATGPWEQPLSLATKEGIKQAKLSGRGLVPLDNWVSSLQQYIADSMMTVQQYRTIKWLQALEIPGTDFHWVEYEHTLAKPAAKAGYPSVQAFLTDKGYVQTKNMPGLVNWYRGAFQDPWMHKSAADLIEGLYDNRGMLRMNKVNSLLTAIRRVLTINPFDNIHLYLSPLYVNPQVLLKAPSRIVGTVKDIALFKTGGSMLAGTYEQLPADWDNYEKAITSGLTAAGRYEQALRAIFDKLELGKFGLQKSLWEHWVEFGVSGAGINTSIYNHYISKMLLDVWNSEYNSFLKKGYSDLKAARYATDLLNDTSMLMPSWSYFNTGPVYRFLFFASNLIVGPLQIYATSAYGLTQAPGMKWMKNLYRYRPGPIAGVFNPFFGTKSQEQLDAVWKKYIWHMIRAIIARIAVVGLMQYVFQKRRPEEEQRLWITDNPKGYQLSADLGTQTEDGREKYYDPQAFRETLFLDLLQKGIPPVFRNKANLWVNWMFSINDYYNEYGVLPSIVRNEKGEVIGGQLVDFMKSAVEQFTPIGLEAGAEPPEWFGLNKREGPRLIRGDLELTEEATRAQKLQRYFSGKASKEFRRKPENIEAIIDKYGLTREQARNLERGPTSVPKKTISRFGNRE